MPLFTPRAFDDRGVEVIYLDPMFHSSQLDRATRERVNRHSDSRQRLVLVLVVLGVIPAVLGLLNSSIPAIIVKLALAITFATFVWVFILPSFRHTLWSRSWKARYKEAGHCPACQYDLRSLTPEEDGCTVCPECGGAWKLPVPDVGNS